MSAETMTYAALSGALAVTAIVGLSIYPDLAAQDKTLPLVVYERGGSEPTYTIGNMLVASKVLMLVSCYALTRSAAEALADACVAAMAAAGHVSEQRDGMFDDATSAYVAVVGFSVWEL